jgi:hypothetical protein
MTFAIHGDTSFLIAQYNVLQASSSFNASLPRPSSAITTSNAGNGVVLPILVQTPSAQEFAAIAENAKTPEPARLSLSATLSLTTGFASAAATTSAAIALYSEGEYAAEVADFLRQPILSLVRV